MNRCAMCGRFKPWAELRFQWAYESTVAYPSEIEWFECRPGYGCAVTEPLRSVTGCAPEPREDRP